MAKFRSTYICVVCLMPAPPTPYAVRYEAGENPGLQRSKFHLCETHAEALTGIKERPVVARDE